MSAESKGGCIIVGMDSQLWGGLLHEPMSHEFWGLNQGHVLIQPLLLKRFTRWFQIHPWGPMVARQRPEHGHVEWLAQCGMPVYLEEAQAEIPTGVRYPYEEVVATIGSNYFATNSFGYMIALAIHERFEEIKLYGAAFGPKDISDAYARPCIEFLLGLAQGRGIRVWVPEGSALLKGDIYGRTVDQSGLALEEALDVLRRYSGQLKYGGERQRVQAASQQLERLYLKLVGGKARHGSSGE